MSSEDPDEDEDYGVIKPLTVLKNRNFAETPCFRESYMYGIMSGLGLGLARFMWTSDVLKSTRFSLLTMGLVSTGYYFYCRDKLARDRFFFDSVRANLQKYVDQQGLDVDVEPPEEPQKVS